MRWRGATSPHQCPSWDFASPQRTLFPEPLRATNVAVNGWYVFFGLLWAYIVFLFWLVRSGRMEKWNLALMLGIVLMIRTNRGKGTIDYIAKPKKFWNFFGDFGTILTLVGMVLMTAVMLLSLSVVLDSDSGLEPLAGNEILIIPGVTPFLPLGYGIVALIVTLVVHEGGHGVLARANNLKVKSLGLLYAIVPIGAFVEPDEDEMKEAPVRHRLRVFAAGATVNIVLAAILVFVFAAMAGQAEPVDGVPILGVTVGSAAESAGLVTGDTIASIDGVAMSTPLAFSKAMELHRPGDVISMETRNGAVLDATLGDRWSDGLTEAQQIATANLTDNRSMDATPLQRSVRATCDQVLGPQNYTDGGDCGDQFLQVAFLGVSHFPVDGLQAVLSDPFGDNGRNFLFYVSMPIGEVRGDPYLSFYIPTFLEEPFEGFWVIGTMIYWIFWINLMVGLTNILPMLPLDGGHIFRDAVGVVVAKVRPAMERERRERMVGKMAAIMSFIILGTFLLSVLGPRFI
jgi:membrane-associated protease RseP (regulator of RpoE activity)